MMAKMALDETAVASLRRILYASATTKWARDHQPHLAGVAFDGDAALTTDAYRMAIAHFDGRPTPKVVLPTDAVRRALPREGDWTPPEMAPIGGGNLLRYRKFVSDCRWQWAVRYDRAALLAFTEGVISGRRRDDRTPIVGLGDGVRVARRVYFYVGSEQHTDEQTFEDLDRDVVGTPLGWVWVNARFLRDMLRAAEPDTVLIEFDEPLRPIMLREPGRTHLIMPIRVV